jgi:CMP-N,N'-diacetyllegionaminic acid synthase
MASGMSEKTTKRRGDEAAEGNVPRPEVLAVIMARGGSVGLPGKAVRDLMGKPVLAYTFEHVRESALVTRAVVSSDSEEILAVARRFEMETILRPAELATATSATDPVLRHAVRALYGGGTTENTANTEATTERNKRNHFPYAVVMLYGNVPLRGGRMIDRCVEMLFATGCDSVQTIAAVGKFHPYWMFDYSEGGKIRKHVANDVFRRQDLPPLFVPTGSVYAVRTEVLMAAEGKSDPHAFLGADRRGLVVGAEDSVDIDSEKDLYIAEALLRVRGT